MEDESSYYSKPVTRKLAPAADKSFERLLQEAQAALTAKKARSQCGSLDNIKKKF